MTLFDILIISHNKEGADISMRKDITIEKIMLGGSKMNKTNLAKQYGCCWRTIDRRLNPDKYKKEKKVRIYKSILDPYKNIIDEKVENNNIPSTGIYFLIKNKYGYKGKYGIVNKYVSIKKKNIISNLTIRFETNLSFNLNELIKELTTKQYKLGKYKKFYIYEPKERLIEALPFKDRVVVRCFCDVSLKKT